MQFTQPVFFLFIIVFFLVWRLFSAQSEYRLIFLVIASFVFYSFGDWRPALVLAGVGLASFLGGLGLESHRPQRRLVLAAALVVSLAPLAVLKYRGFISTNLNDLLGLVGIKTIVSAQAASAAHLPLLGISFYTLQAVGYLLDVYHRRIQPARSLVQYFAYLAMFPKLLSGPIERGKDLLPQLIEPHIAPDESQRWEGTKLIVYGYFLKVVIADNLAPLVDAAFGAAEVRQQSLYWWVVVTAFAFQLYCDFSGYSAIAVGLGKWMGYDLTVNFKHPYTASSLADFWARWHISLSNWLRDYIFFPLNRSRWGRGHPHLNLWITMLVSGLWHGAGWQFIAWGGLHGIFNSLERLTQWPGRLKRLRGGHGVAMLIVWLEVWTAWVFFRAASVSQGVQILKIMFSFNGGWVLHIDVLYFFFLGLGVLREAAFGLHLTFPRQLPARVRSGIEVTFVGLLVAAAVFLRGPGSQFIYFQF